MIPRLLIVLGFCSVLSSVSAAAGRDVWIDADPACGLGETRDVDDCWALVAAIRSSSLNVVSVSTVFGNVDAVAAAAVAQDLFVIMRAHEPNLPIPPVYSGAAEPIRLNPAVPPAVRRLEVALAARPLTILALGPPTNIAMLIERRPDLVHRIDAIVAVAGQRPGQVFKVGSTPILHFHDLNVRKDPDAFDIILRSGVPVHLIPFEAGHQAMVMQSDLDFLMASGTLDRWIARRSTAWLGFWRDTLGAVGFSPFDTVAVTYLINPRHFFCEPMAAEIVRRRGLFVTRDTLEVTRPRRNGRSVTYCSDLYEIARNSMVDYVSNPDHVSAAFAKHPAAYPRARSTLSAAQAAP